ncbi:MAG: hypothetical protein WCS37_21870, partial [Chloroflexota bacterium]
MKTYRVSTFGRFRAAILLLALAALAFYTGRKAWGLWQGLTAKPSDAFLFNFNLNTTVPAFLLSLVALSSLAVAWYLLVELLTEVRLSESGLLVTAPGYRLFYRWGEMKALDVINGPVEDAAVCLRVEMETAPDLAVAEVLPETKPNDEIAAYLSEADLRKDKVARQRVRAARRLDRN